MEIDIDIWPPHEVFYIESLLSITRTALINLSQLQYCLDEVYYERPVNEDQMLDFVQNIISNAGALSRYFWPSSNKPIHKNRAAKLRASCDILEDNPLKDRKVRNFVEHFDENLDSFLAKMLAGFIVPSYVGLKPQNQQVPPKFFRAYYLDKATFCSLDMEYDMMPIIKEINDLHKRLEKFKDSGGRLPVYKKPELNDNKNS